MRPETLPLVSDFKKEYTFLWSISMDPVYYNLQRMWDFDAESTSLFQNVVLNPVFSNYVSQLAEKVTIPDDEFETEDVPQGPVSYKMPKRVQMHDIVVTYLEDSLDTVYHYHKAWYNAIRCGKYTGINSPCNFTATAKYIPFSMTLTATEYVAYENKLSEVITSASNSINIMPSLPLGLKPSSVTTYPKIYPYKISRSEANHSGDNLGRVTVTYARIPVFKKKHAPLQKLSSSGFWVDSTQNNI